MVAVTLDVGMASQNDYGHGIAVQSDDNILIAGPSNGSSGDYTIARYTSAGGLDSAFGTSGVVSVTTGTAASMLSPLSIALQSSGKIIIAGRYYNGSTNFVAVSRFNFDGTLDTSFGVSGRATINVGRNLLSIRAVITQADDKIVVVGGAAFLIYPQVDYLVTFVGSDGKIHSVLNGEDVTTAFTEEGVAVSYTPISVVSFK